MTTDTNDSEWRRGYNEGWEAAVQDRAEAEKRAYAKGIEDAAKVANENATHHRGWANNHALARPNRMLAEEREIAALQILDSIKALLPAKEGEKA